MKNKKYLFIGIILSTIFLFFALKDVHFSRLKQALFDANLYWLFPMIGAAILFFWIKAIRWRLLLTPVHQIRTREIFPSMMVGVAFNYILFGYLGEFFRTYFLCREHYLNKSSVFATIILERIFDLLTILILLGTGLLISPFVPPEITKIGYVALTLGFTSLLMVIVFVAWPKPCLSLCYRLTSYLPNHFSTKLTSQIELGILGLRSISHLGLLIGIITTSIGQWLFMGLCNWFAMIAVGIETPYYAVFMTMTLITFGITLPNSPGHVGIIELCYIFSLKSYGVSADQAFAAAIIFHSFLYSGVILTGIIILQNLGLSIRQATRKAEIPKQEEYHERQ